MKRLTAWIFVLVMMLTFSTAANAQGVMYPHPEVETEITVHEEGTLKNFSGRVWKTIAGEIVRPDMEYGALRYSVYLPESFDSKKEYPILLYLHGGSMGYLRNSKITPWSKDLETYSELIAKGIEDCIILSPQAPGTTEEDKSPENAYWSKMAPREILEGATVNAHESSPYLRATQKLMAGFLEKGISHKGTTYKIDASRVYLAGHSQGAMGSFMMLKDCPEVFAAAIIGAGIGDPDVVESWKDTPVRIYHGTRDASVTFKAFEVMAEALKDCPRAELFPLENANHDIKPYMYTLENFSWMALQDRDAKNSTEVIVPIVLAALSLAIVILIAVFIKKRKAKKQ